jgi:hypothetical protein
MALRHCERSEAIQRYPRYAGLEAPRTGTTWAILLETAIYCTSGGLLRFARNDGAYYLHVENGWGDLSHEPTRNSEEPIKIYIHLIVKRVL